jgi:hypothetical protein
MDNLEDEGASRYYRMESVPWVQYFSKGVGLHGAYWHRSFGQMRSHGCVNLTPLDAQRLFWWTGPHLPAGWTAAFPTRTSRAPSSACVDALPMVSVLNAVRDLGRLRTRSTWS